jgi:hypothetical protein
VTYLLTLPRIFSMVVQSIKCTKEGQRFVIRYLWSDCVKERDIYQRITFQYGVNCVNQKRIHEWIRFKAGCVGTDGAQSGRASIETRWNCGADRLIYLGQPDNQHWRNFVWNEHQSWKLDVQECLKAQFKTFYFAVSKRLVDSWTRLYESQNNCLGKEAVPSCFANILSTVAKNCFSVW